MGKMRGNIGDMMGLIITLVLLAALGVLSITYGMQLLGGG